MLPCDSTAPLTVPSRFPRVQAPASIPTGSPCSTGGRWLWCRECKNVVLERGSPPGAPKRAPACAVKAPTMAWTMVRKRAVRRDDGSRNAGSRSASFMRRVSQRNALFSRASPTSCMSRDCTGLDIDHRTNMRLLAWALSFGRQTPGHDLPPVPGEVVRSPGHRAARHDS